MNIVWYTAIGIHHVRMAKNSIASLQKEGRWKGPIMVVTDYPFQFEGCITHPPIDNGLKAFETRRSKIGGWRFLAHYKKALYLDCDTIVLQPIDHIWNFQGDASIASCQIHRTFAKFSLRTWGGVVADIKECKKTISPETFWRNSGVIIARIKSWLPIVEDWMMEWKKFRWVDEPAMMRAIEGQEISLLSGDYNWTGVPCTNTIISHQIWHPKR